MLRSQCMFIYHDPPRNVWFVRRKEGGVNKYYGTARTEKEAAGTSAVRGGPSAARGRVGGLGTGQGSQPRRP